MEGVPADQLVDRFMTPPDGAGIKDPNLQFPVGRILDWGKSYFLQISIALGCLLMFL